MLTKEEISKRGKKIRQEWEKQNRTAVQTQTGARAETSGGRLSREEVASRGERIRQEWENPAERATSARQARWEEEDEEPGGLLGGLMSVMQRSTELQNRTAYRNEEIRQEADRELGQAVANAITPDDPVKALGRAQRSTGLRTVPAERREEIVRESLREDGHTDEEIDAAKARTPEALYNEYNQWLEEGDNRQRLNDLVQSEQAARKESDIDGRMHKLGYTDAEIEEIRARRREYEQSVPFGYDITHRIGSSVEGIGSEAVGAAMLIPQTVGTAVGNFFNRRELDTGDESHDELLKAVERVRNSNGMYTLDELAANNDRGWTMQDIQAAAAELDGAKESVDMDSLGGQIYRQGGEKLAEARLGLSDLQELAYGAAESAGENIALGALNPALLLAEQTLRSAGGGIADSAADGMSAGQSLLSGLGHGAVSAGIEQIGIGQMMRNMGMRTGMSGAVDSILDRIAALPGMDRLTPTVAGIVANAGEEAAEEFVQSYADAAVDNLLGSQSAPGMLSGELLAEAAQSALGGAVGGGLIGGISTGIGAAQDVRQGRIAPRADLAANAQLSAAVERAGQVGQAAQAAAGAAGTQAPAQQVQQAAGQQRTAPDGTGQQSPQPRTVDPQLAELAAQSGGRLDAGAWQAMQQAANAERQSANTETQSANAERMAAREQYQAAQRQARMAERQSLTDRQRDEAMLLEGNTSMSEAAVNVAARAMPEGVGGEVYSVAANTVYQMARQGIAEDWDTALDLAGRYGVRVNQVLAAPGGAEALQMVYNQGQMDGIEAAGYGAAGLADERQAGQVEYQPGALVPEEDRALFDLYAAASDTAVTVSERLERNAGGYVDTALGKVYFGAQAGADTFGTILHESVHQYNAWDEAGGRELQTATLRYMAEQSGFESVNELVESYIQRYQEAGQELSYAQACEEITADAMRGVFGSEEAFGRWVEHQRALAGQNSGQRSAVARVMDKVRGMLDKVIEKAKSILAREPDNAAAKQAQALAENQKRTLEELYYKHAETAMEAQRAAREGGTESETFNSQSVESGESSEQNLKNEAGGRTAAEARRQYQLREKAGRGQYPQAGWTGKENAAYETLTALPDMEITEIDSRKVRRRHSVNEVMDDAFANMGAGRDAREATVTNRYTGMEVTVSRKGIRHSFHKHEDINERGPYVQQIGSILKNAVKVNELDKRTGPKSRGEDYSDVYLGAARNEKGELVGVRLIVNVYENGKAELDLDSVEPTGNLHGHVGTKIGDAEASPNRAPAAHWQNSQRSATRRTVSGTVVQGPRASTAEAEPSHIASIAYEGRQVNGAGTKIGDAEASPAEAPAGPAGGHAVSRSPLQGPRASTAEAAPSHSISIAELIDAVKAAPRTPNGKNYADWLEGVFSRDVKASIGSDVPVPKGIVGLRYQLPVDERAMESGQRAAAWENTDRAALAEYLSELYQNGEVRRVPVERVQQLARRILSDSASKANESTVTKQLDGLMQYMDSGQADFETAFGAAEGIADGVLQKSTRRDSSLWNEYKDLHYFTVYMERGGPEYQEMVYQYGSYALAQKELGRNGIKLTTAKGSNVRGIDQLYQELSNAYPGLFPSEITGAAEQLDRIAQVRQSIRPQIKNNFGENYEEARADLAMQIIGAAVGEGVTDQGVAGMLRQRIDENLNLHRSGIQRRVVNALNEQAREARNEGFAQAQRIVRASGEANRKRLEAERKAWANTSNAMREAMARSRNTAQRARDARRADQLRRQIVVERTKLNRMLLHPSDQYHVPQKFMQAAVQVAELGNHYTYNKKAVEKLQALRSQLGDLAKAAEEGDSFAADWENSGISQMLASLNTSMDRASSARLEGQAKAQAGRIESGQKRLNELRDRYENMDLGDRVSFTPDELAILRDTMRAMVTVIQNSNRLLATRTAQNASEFASVATQEVATSRFRLKGRSNPFEKFQNKWNANFNNAERMLMHMGGYRHGGAMEALSKTLSEGEAKQTEIREKGLQGFANVLKGKENEKKLRKFSGVDAELLDVGLVLENGEAVEVNRAQAAGLYMHLLNPQNREHVTKGGIVVPDMKAYARGNMEDAYRLRQTAHMKDAGETLQKLERMLEQDEYFRQWVDDTKEFFGGYTKNVINETSRRLSGYDKATVDNYYPLAVDRSVLQQEIQGVIYNGTIEGRGFLKPRQEHAAQPVLLEEIDRVMVRSLADTAAYGGLAMAVRDANKILNANHQEGNSLYGAIENAFGKEGVKFVKDYLSDLQRQRQAEKSIYDFLGGLRGNYAGAVLTLNLSTVLGQYSGVPAAAAELGTDATWKAFAFMVKPQKAETLEAIRKEMTGHGYWQLESTLSTGATAELAELRKKRGVISWVAEHTPGVNALEHMDMKTRVALWEGSKHYVDQHLEEFNLPADAHGSDAWWDAVRVKMTQANDRTQPNYTVSQQAAIQRSTDQLVKTLVMFKSQSFQNLGIVTSAVEDYRAQSEYAQAAAKKLESANLDSEQRQQAQAELEHAQSEQKTAAVRLKRAVASQAASSALYVVATLFVKDLLLHRYDRDKDEDGKITLASVARRVGWETAMNLLENVPLLDVGMSIVQGDSDPISLSGIDSIADAADDARKLVSAILNEDRTSKDEQAQQDYWSRLAEQAFDTLESGLNLAGVPFGQFNRWRESVMGWIGDISTAKNSDGLNLWDVMNAPKSSASQYDRLYTAVFEEPDAEDAAKALQRLADLDALTPPAKASNAKAGDGKVLGELLKREREYGTRVQDAAAARVAGNEDEQRRLRQELVDVLAGALGISQTDKADARRLRTVIDKVDAAITSEVKAQLGADSTTGATVYTPLLTAIEDGGDVAGIQTGLRRAGVDDGAMKSAVVSAYKDEYLYGSESTRQRIEGQLLALKDANGKPYFTKTKDQDDFADWVTDWELQGLNDNVYTDLDEALATENKAAAKEQIDRYMAAGKSADSIRTRMANLYRREYIDADGARRREIAQFLVGLRGPKGEKIVTVDTLTGWIRDDAREKAAAGM